MTKYRTAFGPAVAPFRKDGSDHVLDAARYQVWEVLPASGWVVLASWAQYQAELAAAYAVFDVPDAPADVCTCGGQKYGGGTCSDWCDSSAARAQHAGGYAS